MSGPDAPTATESNADAAADDPGVDDDGTDSAGAVTGGADDRFVVDGEARRCPHCDWPFASEHLLALHLGEVHPETLTESDLVAYEAAREREHDDLFVFHLKVVAAFTVLLFAFIYTYAFVWAG